MPPADPAAPAAPAQAPAAAAPAAQPAAPAAAPAAAAPAAEVAKPASTLIGGATAEAAKPAAPATLEEAKAFLLARPGILAADLAGLTEQQLRAKYDQEKAAADKAAEPAKDGDKPKDGEVADFELKVPDGFTIEEKTLTELKGILADAKMTPGERGEKLLAMHAAALAAATEASNKLWTDTQADWQTKVKADPEVGGKNYDSTRQLLAVAIDTLGGKEAQKMREAFDFTGAGNHPEIVRLMRRVGALLSEGGHVAGNPAGGDGSSKSAAQVLYPTHA